MNSRKSALLRDAPVKRSYIFAMNGFVVVALAAACVSARPASDALPRHLALPEQSSEKPCGTVTVAAASDLTYALKELAANFQKETGCEVRVSLGSSGNFLTQIENGAPFDVFLSADIAYPRKLESEGMAAPGNTYLYAIGKIVLWVRNDSHLDPTKEFALLRDPAVKKIAIANPAHAPYGRAAEEALRNAGAYDAVKERLVLGENISQAAQFVESGNAQAGIIALSLAVSPEMKDQGHYWVVPENLHAPIEQGAAIVRAAANPPGAKRFLDYIKTPASIAVLKRYGFVLPSKNSAKERP